MDEIICPNCQTHLPARAEFCDNCGANLRGTPAGAGSQTGGTVAPPSDSGQMTWQTCPTCQNQVRAGAKFCDNCGASLVVPPAVATPRLRDLAPTVLESAPSAADRTVVESLPAHGGASPAPVEKTTIEPRTRSPYVIGRLVVIASGARLEFPPGRTEIIVGREDPVGNVFPEVDLTPHGGETGGVSRRHARFSLQAGELAVEDLNSTNYTFVNNQRVLPGTRQTVRAGDEVRFGRIKTKYESG